MGGQSSQSRAIAEAGADAPRVLVADDDEAIRRLLQRFLSAEGYRVTPTKLREMGFRIALDDIGAGYAGLTSFAALEPDVMKLDMSLVRGIHTSKTKRKLVGTMIQACLDLGVLVVGEGVETTEERDVLVELGCDLLQGYLFAKPQRAFATLQF